MIFVRLFVLILWVILLPNCFSLYCYSKTFQRYISTQRTTIWREIVNPKYDFFHFHKSLPSSIEVVRQLYFLIKWLDPLIGWHFFPILLRVPSLFQHISVQHYRLLFFYLIHSSCFINEPSSILHVRSNCNKTYIISVGPLLFVPLFPTSNKKANVFHKYVKHKCAFWLCLTIIAPESSANENISI